MAIPESQLDIWAKQGSVTQSQATYASVRGVLNRDDAPYAAKDYGVFLQGSYGNETNIYADSDVDIVIGVDSVFYKDISGLSEPEKAAYKANFSGSAYSYSAFKADVTKHLTTHYGSAVKPGKKAIFIQGNGSRRDTDVLPAAQYRKYHRFSSSWDQSYTDGIVFWTPDGTEIVNYPKRHSANCTTKHQATNMWFKPTVRILKNMRNAMVAKGYIKDGLAPSYFLEGMLYNVPNGQFGKSYEDCVVNAINWVVKSDRPKLVSANEMYYLIHPTAPGAWRAESLDAYLTAVTKLWKEW
jgi:hypothetical protein